MPSDVQGAALVLSKYSEEGLEVRNTLHELVVEDIGKWTRVALACKPDHRYFVDTAMPFDYTQHKWLIKKLSRRLEEQGGSATGTYTSQEALTEYCAFWSPLCWHHWSISQMKTPKRT